MRQLFLHVGTYKTATTTLQAVCAGNRSWLVERGVLYPGLRLERSTGTSINHRLFAERVLAGLESKRFRGLPAYWQAEMVPQLEADPSQRVLISAEGFSRLPLSPDPEREDALKGCLSGFDVRVIVYVRRQDHWYEAMHNQEVKAGSETRALSEYVAGGIAAGRADYARQLEFWARLFGERNLVVRVFEPAQLHQGDIVQDFMPLIGIGDLTGLRAVPDRNPRLAPELLEFKRTFVNPRLRNYYHRRIAQLVFGFSQRFLPEAKGRSMPYDLACEIMRQHAASNERVARRFLGRDSGALFSSDPENEPRWKHRQALHVALHTRLFAQPKVPGVRVR
ncbi:MAG: hypothetical protein JW940_39170 [Polyangiaceae bacterium]|nr:hypothetical protein [Polyangiaceae bacterium]